MNGLKTTCDSLEAEADRLLQEAGAFKGKGRVYREEHLGRLETPAGLNMEWFDLLCTLPESPRVALSEALREADLTDRQREAIGLMQRLGNQTLVGKRMELNGQPAVSQLLDRAFAKIREAQRRLEERLPSREAEQLFYEEIRYKLSLIYRRPRKERDKISDLRLKIED